MEQLFYVLGCIFHVVGIIYYVAALAKLASDYRKPDGLFVITRCLRLVGWSSD